MKQYLTFDYQFSIIMKNIELYRTIEALVEAKKQQCSPGKPSFAHEYCKQQIQKKKLIPFNPKSKMNRIMKNFHQLDTYVNVEELFQYINMLVAQRQKEDIKTHTHIKWRSKQKIAPNDYQIIDKVREKLGPYNQKIFLKQNQEMWSLIQQLEQKSCIGSYRKQNSPNNNDFSFYTQNTKQKQQDKKFVCQKQQWRFYEGNNYIFQDLAEKRQIKTPQIQKLMLEKPNLKKRQQRRQLIHQVATYLQIILENHHKKKWGKRQTSVDDKQNVIMQPSIQQKEKIKPHFKIQRLHSINTQHKSVGQKTLTTNQKSSPNNSFIRIKKLSSTKANSRVGTISQNNSFISKKVGVKENFTFRNRNIKQGLMKKLDSFLEFVETQQRQFKKQKNNSINQLIYLQNRQKNNYRFCDKALVVDDHQIKAVQNIVRSQK